MSSLMERIVDPSPVDIPMESVREGVSYNVSVTLLRQTKTAFVPIDGHENLQGRVYPYSQGQQVDGFEVGRKITDRIKLMGYYPRTNSSMIARILQPGGESVMYDVHDVEHDGDPLRTSLISRRRGVDKQ